VAGSPDWSERETSLGGTSQLRRGPAVERGRGEVVSTPITNNGERGGEWEMKKGTPGGPGRRPFWGAVVKGDLVRITGRHTGSKGKKFPELEKKGKKGREKQNSLITTEERHQSTR